MVDWVKIYEEAEDMTLEMLEELKAEREAEKAQQASQDGTGITTTLPAEKPRD